MNYPVFDCHLKTKETAMSDSNKANALKELIERAMDDLEITTTEYNEILASAGDDNVEDNQEKALLNQFQQMIANGTIKRVPG